MREHGDSLEADAVALVVGEDSDGVAVGDLDHFARQGDGLGLEGKEEEKGEEAEFLHVRVPHVMVTASNQPKPSRAASMPGGTQASNRYR